MSCSVSRFIMRVTPLDQIPRNRWLDSTTVLLLLLAIDRKRNMALDEETKPHDLLGLSDDEVSVSEDSDQEESERFSAHHLRRDKNVRSVLDTASENSDEEDDESDSEQEERDISDNASASSTYESEEEQEEEEEQQLSDSSTTKKSNVSRANKKNKLKKLTPEELEKFEKEQKRSGVCYLSRIPPFMTPQQVKKLLSHYAEVGRVFFETEGIWIRYHGYKVSWSITFIFQMHGLLHDVKNIPEIDVLVLQKAGSNSKTRNEPRRWLNSSTCDKLVEDGKALIIMTPGQ